MSHRNAVAASAATSHPPLPRRPSTRQNFVAVAPMMALVAFTLLVATVTFVLSFVGLRDYGATVAGVPTSLAWLVPVGVDGLTLCAVAATFALRHAPWHVRLYAWSVFGVAIIASVAGNLSHAVARDLSWDGQVGAAAWPSLLALASHLVIVTWRHVERRLDDTPATPAPTDVATPAAPPAPTSRQPGTVNGATVATPLVVVTRQRDNAKPASATDRPSTVSRQPAHAPDRASLVRRVADGELSAGDAAELLGVSRRTVERDVAKAARQRQPALA